MSNVLELIEYLQNYTQAIKNGIDKFVAALPLHTRQYVKREAQRRLNTTAKHYNDHVNIKLVDYVLIVETDRDDWLVNALELGVSTFDMKPGLLASPKAKMSKKGFRYIRVPIGKEKGGTGGSTEKSKDYQRRINEVLSKPNFGIKKLKTLITGKIVESQQVISSDPLLKGFHRVRQFDNIETYHKTKARPKWEYVLFRTVSENPLATAKWEHPGIKPVNIMRSTQQWLNEAVPVLLDGFIKDEVGSLQSKMKERE